MTFLSKLGSILATVGKAVAVAAGLEPLIAPFLGSKGSEEATVVVSDLGQIASVVTTAEAMLQSPATGAQKLAAATPLVMQILQTTEMFSGKKLADTVTTKNTDGTTTTMSGQALFNQGAQLITSGMADLLNALHPDEVKT